MKGRAMAPAEASCTYLHHQCWSAAGSDSGTHAHDHWQLEYIHTGTVSVDVPRAHCRRNAGEAMLIPPGLRHRFVYPSNGCRFVSVKFLSPSPATADRMILIAADHAAAAIGLALYRLCDGAPLVASGRHRRIIETLISAVLTIAEGPVCLVPDEIDAVGVIARLVRERRGGPVTVAEVAHACGCAPRTLRERFQRRGRAGLKGVIDHHRAVLAQEQLRYSDASITVIAEDLGFPDLYSFSRFFRRTTGESPRAFRAREVPYDRAERLHG